MAKDKALEELAKSLYREHLKDFERFDRNEPFREIMRDELRDSIDPDEAIEFRLDKLLATSRKSQTTSARSVLKKFKKTGQLPILECCEGLLAIKRYPEDDTEYFEYVKLSACNTSDLIEFARIDAAEIEANATEQKLSGEGAILLGELLDEGHYDSVAALLVARS